MYCYFSKNVRRDGRRFVWGVIWSVHECAEPRATYIGVLPSAILEAYQYKARAAFEARYARSGRKHRTHIMNSKPATLAQKEKIPGFFTVIRPCMVRFFQIENPTVRFGAVLKNRKSYGAVRCGFHI